MSARSGALTRDTAAGGLRRFLVPDLALVASLITLIYCLFLFHGYEALFRDSDAGWHIRTGESILATGALPHSDPFSFTRSGEPWFAWEWGADVLMGALHRAGGLSAVAGFYALAIAAGVWLWFQLNWKLGGSFLIACALAAPMLSTTNIHWLARPHVLSWLFLLAALIALERGHLLAAGALTALWSNMHASFFLAPLIAVIYATGHLIRPLIWDLDRASEFRKARRFGWIALVCSAASLLNPYGWSLHRHVFTYLADSGLMARIGEFQSFNFHAEGAFQIALTLSLAMLGGALALSQKQLPQALLSAVLIFAALRSARGLPLVALALLPIANAAITVALESARNLQPTLRRSVDSFLAYSSRLRAIDAQFSGVALVAIVAILLFAVNAPAGFPKDQFPVAASDEVAKLPVEARILAPDKFGGYLIYRFAGARKVFFDGRSDLYGVEFLKQYARLTQLRDGWRAQLDEFGFTHALLPNDYSLVPALEALGWKRLYRDGTATLLAR